MPNSIGAGFGIFERKRKPISSDRSRKGAFFGPPRPGQRKTDLFGPQRTGGGLKGPQLTGTDTDPFDVSNDPFVRSAQERFDFVKAALKRIPTVERKRDFAIAKARLDLAKQQALERPVLEKQFRESLAKLTAQQSGLAKRRFAQQSGARGLAFSGIEQAGLQNIEAQAGQQQAVTFAQFETNLLQAQKARRDLFEQNAFKFVETLQLMQRRFDFDKALLLMQSAIKNSKDKTKQWIKIGVEVAKIVASLA